MAGDPLHDAFKADLDAVAAIAGVALPWLVKDTRNTVDDPDAGSPFVDFEFVGNSEDQFTTGAPGFNLHQEIGQITINFHMTLGNEGQQEQAGRYADLMRKAYRNRRFACDGRVVRIFSPSRMAGGQDDAGMWVEFVALTYEMFNEG